MKARVFEIKRFAVHDGDGIRTTVFLKGCPLKCLWCHNPEGISSEHALAYYSEKCINCGECVNCCLQNAHKIENGRHIFDRDLCVGCGRCAELCLGGALTFYGGEMTVDELMPRLLEDREFYGSSGGGVTVSGGECLLHADFCRELLSRLTAEGINTAVDTSGFVSRAALDKVIPYTDSFLYDIKAASGDTHRRATGQDNALILENLRYLNSQGKRIEVRIPFVPDYNAEEIEAIAELLSTVENLACVRLLPYHSYAGSKYAALGMENSLPERLPTEEELEAARETLRARGIKCI